MTMKWTSLVSVFALACTYHNPKPQYGQTGPKPQPQHGAPTQPAQQPAVATQPSQPAPPEEPVAPPEEPLPIPIDGEMPKESLTTNATLKLGEETTITLDARSDIYSASAKKADSTRQGVLPSELTLAKGGTVVSFPKVVGKTSCNAGDFAYADGGTCAGGETEIKGAGKLSGIVHKQKTMFVVGVFVGPKLPAKAPADLDFSEDAKGTKFEKLEPGLGQVFFVGDGSPGNPPGGTHDFVIPKGATRLYLGYADA